MGTSLTGNNISASYLGLLKSTDSLAIGGTKKIITDGAGNDLPFGISTSSLTFNAGAVDVPTLSIGTINEGFYQPTDETIGVSINGSEVARFLSTGLSLTSSKLTLSNDQKIRWTSDDVYIQGTTSADNIQLGVGGSTQFTFAQTTGMRLHQYGSGSITGTVTQRLGVTSTGQVVEIPIGGGAVDGSGTANTVTMWSDTDTITDAPITVSGNNVTITSSGDTALILDSANPGSTSIDFFEGSSEKAHITFDTVSNILTMGRAGGDLAIDNSGRVGIGTTSPNGLLELTADNPQLVFTDTNEGTDKKTFRFINIDEEFRLTARTDNNVANADGGDVFKITRSGNSTFAGNLNIADTKKIIFGGTASSGDDSASISFNDSTGILNVTASSADSHKVQICGDTIEAVEGGTATFANGATVQSALSVDSIQTIGSGTTMSLGTSAGNVMTLLNSNLGVNVTSPTTAKLVVAGDVNTFTLRVDGYDTTNQSFGARIRAGTSSSDTALLVENTSASELFKVAGDGNATVAGAVGVGVTAGSNAKLEVVSTSGEVFRADASSGAFRIVANQTGVSTQGAFSHTGDGTFTGNLGIGTTSPSVLLDARLSTTTGKVAELHNSVGYGIGFTVESDGGVNTINSESNQALAFATNGASNERMRIDSSGNVGIGTSSPNALLDLDGGKIRVSSSGTRQLEIGTDATISFGSDDNIQVRKTGSDLQFKTGGSERMRIDSSGRLLINRTSSNGDILEVDGNANVYSARFNGNTTTGQSYGLRVRAGTNSLDKSMLVENTSGTDLFTISGDGNATFAGNITFGDSHFIGDDSFDNLHILASSGENVVIQAPSGNSIDLKTAGGTTLTLDSSQNVGIGTTSAGAKLNVFTGGNSIAAAAVLQHDSFGNDRKVGLGFELGNTQIKGAVGFISDDDTSSQSNGIGNLIFCVDSNDDAAPVGHADEKMRITHGGNVGIATDSPSSSYKLDVFGGSTSIQVGNSSGTGRFGADGSSTKVGSSSNHPFVFLSSNTERMRLASGGNLLVNTTTNYGNVISVDQAGNYDKSSDSAGIRIFSSSGTTNNGDYHGAIQFSRGTGSASISAVQTGSDNDILGLAFFTHPTGTGTDDSEERMRVTSAGDVGIGTTSPNHLLDVESAGASMRLFNTTSNGNTEFFVTTAGTTGASKIMFGDTDDADIGKIIYRHNGNSMAFETNDSEAMRILSDGKVGIGTTSPSSKLTLSDTSSNSIVQVRFINDARDYALGVHGGLSDSFVLYDDTADQTRLIVDTSGKIGVGTTSPETKLDVNSGISSSSANVISISQNTTGAIKQAVAFGVAIQNGGEATNASDLFISTASGGSLSERMRITSGGDVLVGTTSEISTGNGFSITNTGQVRIGRASTGIIKQIVFSNPNDEVGSISTSGSATAYNTSSDYRLKEDLKDFNALEIASKIKMYDFKWKADDSRSYGVMAHELQEVVPQAVSGDKDAKDMQQVDYSKLVPILLKSIQELEARVKELEKEI